MTPTAVGTYVYCVITARKPPVLSRALAGPPGSGRPRVVQVRPAHYLVVSDAPLDQFGEEPITRRLADLRWVSRAAVAHEAVIESLLGASDALVPMKLFTMFASDDRAVSQTRTDWARIDRVLRRVARHAEWGVRLSLDERRAAAVPELGPVKSGLGYLRAKQRLQSAAATHARRNHQRVTSTFRKLSSLASDARRRPLAAVPADRRRLLLDAAFLVPLRRAKRFRAAVERQARALSAEGYRVQLTGPWPPYSFVAEPR